MVEIEIKFNVTPEEKNKLIAGAVFKKNKENTDSYYDTGDFSLIRKDIWLRNRNGNFELKLPRSKNVRGVTSYEEIEDKEKIKEYFSFDKDLDLEKSLETHGYRPFSTFKTKRESYEREGITLEFDTTIFDDDFENPFVITEAEVMVPDNADVQEERNTLVEKVKSFGVNFAPAGGKGTQYFKRYKPEFYQEFFEQGKF